MTPAAGTLPTAIPSARAFQDLLIQADRAQVVASLSRGMAHDLRGPLQTLTLFADPGTDILAGAESARLRTAVTDAVTHLTDTIARFSQVYSPHESEASPIIVEDLLGTVADLQRYQRGLPAVELELRLPGGLPPVRGQESALRHILLGLLLNAKQAMGGTAEPRIVLSATALDGQVIITVEDNGSGIPAADLDQALEPFWTTREGHLGIGLAASRLLAEQMGGGLRLRPEPRGARVELQLRSWARAG